jgi:hypothetical protein
MHIWVSPRYNRSARSIIAESVHSGYASVPCLAIPCSLAVPVQQPQASPPALPLSLPLPRPRRLHLLPPCPPVRPLYVPRLGIPLIAGSVSRRVLPVSLGRCGFVGRRLRVFLVVLVGHSARIGVYSSAMHSRVSIRSQGLWRRKVETYLFNLLQRRILLDIQYQTRLIHRHLQIRRQLLRRVARP